MVENLDYPNYSQLLHILLFYLMKKGSAAQTIN